MIQRVRTIVRPSRRLRLRYAWHRFRLGRERRRIADAAAADFERKWLGL